MLNISYTPIKFRKKKNTNLLLIKLKLKVLENKIKN